MSENKTQKDVRHPLLKKMREEINGLLNSKAGNAEAINQLESSSSVISAVSGYIGEYPLSSSNVEIVRSVQAGTIAISGINFLYIPFLYLKAYLNNEKIPFTLSNNSQWIYSAVLMALTLTAFLVPFTAPIIAFVVAGLGFSASVIYLGNSLYKRYVLYRDIKQNEDDLELKKGELSGIDKQVISLESQYEELKKDPTRTFDTEIDTEITNLHHEYQKKINEMKDINLKLEQKKRSLSQRDIKNSDKAMGVFLASATIIGLVVAVFFPPVGLAILGAVAAVGAAYVLGRLSLVLAHSINRWLPTRKEDKTVVQYEVISPLHNSTADILDTLSDLPSDDKKEQLETPANDTPRPEATSKDLNIDLNEDTEPSSLHPD